MVRLDVTPPVARILVDRPEARNAMTFQMYQDFYEACESVDARPDVRVVIIRGGEGTFIAGTDIREFTALQGGEDALAYERRIDSVVGRVEHMSKVTIAAIEGYATGGGFTIALACDLRYATADARLGVPIGRTLGNCLSMANYARLVEAVGSARARELLVTARLLSAEEAQAFGLVTEVVAAGELDRRVAEAAGEIVALAPLTITASKEAIRRILERQRQIDGDDLIVRCYTSRDFREAVQAFLEKRTPVWEGR